jgi:hypothetical protein
MQRTLIVIGLLVLVVGLLWPWVSQLGRLPGDLVIDKPGFKLYVPISTMILVSAVISLLLWISRS